MYRLALLFLSLALCFSALFGCQREVANDPTENSLAETEEYTETATAEAEPDLPSVTGSMEAPKLEVLSWDSGRANESSGNRVWETETGIYFVWFSVLYYADKSNLSQWVPVCSMPECAHSGSTCDAMISWEVLLKGDRFYFNSNTNDTTALNYTGLYSTFIASMALDGTDKELEYYIPEAEDRLRRGDGYVSRPYLLTDQLVYALATLNHAGYYDVVVYLVDEDGVTTIFESTEEDVILGGVLSRTSDLYGDDGFFSYIFDKSSTTVYRIQDRKALGVDLMDLPWEGAYLDGNTLRIFRTGDGYYEVDLDTREEVKLADAQLAYSFSHIMEPNCILESTVFGHSALDFSEFEEQFMGYRSLVEEHTMKLFDGQQWQDVILPEEVTKAADTEILIPQALTSDRILLTFKDAADTINRQPPRLYQILLGTDTPTLEYLGTIG